MMAYLCGKFSDCSFSHFGSIVWTNRYTDADEHLTRATLVSVSRDCCNSLATPTVAVVV